MLPYKMSIEHASAKQPVSASGLYQHDANETLDTMTLQGPGAACQSPTSGRSVSAPYVMVSPPMSSSSSTTFPMSSPTASRAASREGGGSPRTGGSSRIPRRVQSSLCNKIGGGDGGSKRSSLSVYSNSSTVSTCLLNSNLGGGDCVSLDPEVDTWLEMIPLSKRPFRNFHRDFADGVLMAELLAYFFPKKVDLHNYVPASAARNKKANWHTLNHKVLSKMGIRFSDSLIEEISQAKPGFIEKALRQVHRLVDNIDRQHTELRALELSGLASSFNGMQPFVEELCLVRNTPGEIPDCVIYQNIKYYPSTAFDEIARNEEALREKNNELCNKVRRLETMINLKENHLQDLTSKIHELKARQVQEVPQIPPEYGSGSSNSP